MPIITRLVIQKKRRNRVSVHLDGDFAFGIPLTEAVPLKVGQELTDAEIAALQKRAAYHGAYQRALDYVSRRPRSCAEVERYLLGRQVDSDDVARIVARLEEIKALDDEAFARHWIENRETFRPRSVYALRHELRGKGLDETLIDKILMEFDLDEVASAFRVAEKYLPRLRSIQDNAQFQKKLAGYLARRGFGWDIIREVSGQLWQRREEEEAEG